MARPQTTEPRSNIRRRRTGCLTCRERRVRCGEEKPACKNCSRKARTCSWAKDGDRFLHHRPNISTRPEEIQEEFEQPKSSYQTPYGTADGINSKSCQLSAGSPSTNDVFAQLPTPAVSTVSPIDRQSNQCSDAWQWDSNASIQHTRSNSWGSSSDNLSLEELSAWRTEIAQSFDEEIPLSRCDPASSICRSQSARLKNFIDLEHESTVPPNLEPNAEVFSDWRTLGASETVVTALSGDKEIKLLQVYLRECAHWFDAFDGQRHYARKSVARMMTCPPWRAAALALSAKYMELHQRQKLTADSLSLHLYQLAVQLAIDSISGRFDCVGTTAGCVILAVYEMMTVTYHDWRRHLRGCTSIYSHNHWNGDSFGLIGAVYSRFRNIVQDIKS